MATGVADLVELPQYVKKIIHICYNQAPLDGKMNTIVYTNKYKSAPATVTSTASVVQQQEIPPAKNEMDRGRGGHKCFVHHLV